MKNLKELGKTLNRNEQIKIYGGNINIPPCNDETGIATKPRGGPSLPDDPGGITDNDCY